MEAAQRRRLSIIASHLNPITIPPTPTDVSSSIVTRSHCDSCSDSEKQCNLENDCIFCKIVRGDAPALKLYEDDECLCILDNQPVSPGHCLIIPRGHFPSLVATPPSVVAAMCSKVPYISKAVMKATGSDSFNLLVNNGVDAGQVIFHTHIHIIPRRPRDCLWASESLKRHPLKLDQEALHLVNNIRQQLSFVDGFEDNKDHGTTLIGSQLVDWLYKLERLAVCFFWFPIWFLQLGPDFQGYYCTLHVYIDAQGWATESCDTNPRRRRQKNLCDRNLCDEDHDD